MTFHKIDVQRGVVTKKLKCGYAVLVNVMGYLNATSTIIHHTKLLGGNAWNIENIKYLIQRNSQHAFHN